MSAVRDQTIALAAMMQSLALVQDAARTGGGAHADAFEVCIGSVLRLDAQSTMAVYGSPAELRLGLDALLPHVQRRMSPQHAEQARYAANLMYLERRLSAEPQVTARLRDDLLDVRERFGECARDDEQLLAALAAIYVERVSPLGPRVLVNGEPAHLRRETTAARIRALLLAGVRAAVLWRQRGGRRLTLLLARRRIAAAALTLLDEAG